MVDAGDPFALAFEGLHDIAPILSPAEADGRRRLRRASSSGGSAIIRPYWPPRGIVGISLPASSSIWLSLRCATSLKAAGTGSSVPGARLSTCSEIDELFEVVQRLMRGNSDRPAGGGRHPWSGKLERRAEIGQRRIAFIQRCPHAGQQHARGVFARIGLDGLERILFCLGEIPQLEGSCPPGPREWPPKAPAAPGFARRQPLRCSGHWRCCA